MQRGPRFGIQNTLLLNLGTHVVVIIPASWSSLINYLPKTEMLPCMQTQPRHVSPSFWTFSSKVFSQKRKWFEGREPERKYELNGGIARASFKGAAPPPHVTSLITGRAQFYDTIFMEKDMAKKISGECVSAVFWGGAAINWRVARNVRWYFHFFFLAISLVHSLLARKVKKMENEARSTFRMRSVLLKLTDVARSIFPSPENGIINAIRLVGRYETILPWFFDFNEPILEEFQSSAFSTWPWKNPYSFSFLLPPRYDFWLGSRVICCRRIWKY